MEFGFETQKCVNPISWKEVEIRTDYLAILNSTCSADSGGPVTMFGHPMCLKSRGHPHSHPCDKWRR